MMGEETGAGKSSKKMPPGERENKRERWALPTPLPGCSWLAHPFRQLLCSCNEHTEMYLTHHLWSLQGLAGWHLPGGTSGRSEGMFLFQFPAKWGCLVAYTPWFCFLFFTGRNCYACTPLTLNIWYMFPGQFVKVVTFAPETGCLITDLLELENITFEMIP